MKTDLTWSQIMCLKKIKRCVSERRSLFGMWIRTTYSELSNVPLLTLRIWASFIICDMLLRDVCSYFHVCPLKKTKQKKPDNFVRPLALILEGKLLQWLYMSKYTCSYWSASVAFWWIDMETFVQDAMTMLAQQPWSLFHLHCLWLVLIYCCNLH